MEMVGLIRVSSRNGFVSITLGKMVKKKGVKSKFESMEARFHSKERGHEPRKGKVFNWRIYVGYPTNLPRPFTFLASTLEVFLNPKALDAQIGQGSSLNSKNTCVQISTGA